MICRDRRTGRRWGDNVGDEFRAASLHGASELFSWQRITKVPEAGPMSSQLRPQTPGKTQASLWPTSFFFFYITYSNFSDYFLAPPSLTCTSCDQTLKNSPSVRWLKGVGERASELVTRFLNCTLFKTVFFLFVHLYIAITWPSRVMWPEPPGGDLHFQRTITS